jgi:hypothetical protein
LPELFPDWLDAVCLTLSQVLLLGFAWLNRKIIGMPILICGVILNLAVMAANGGFMPISPQTASRLISEEALLDIQPGSRIGPKDILLHPQDTRLEGLADRFIPAAWFPYQGAFSLGDVFIAIGAFWILARPIIIYQKIEDHNYARSIYLSKDSVRQSGSAPRSFTWHKPRFFSSIGQQAIL